MIEISTPPRYVQKELHKLTVSYLLCLVLFVVPVPFPICFELVDHPTVLKRETLRDTTGEGEEEQLHLQASFSFLKKYIHITLILDNFLLPGSRYNLSSAFFNFYFQLTSRSGFHVYDAYTCKAVVFAINHCNNHLDTGLTTTLL